MILRITRYTNLFAKQKMMMGNLIKVQQAVQSQIELKRELSGKYSSNQKGKMLEALREEYPDQYEELIKEYFKLLSRYPAQ